jgi:hypothetical protein
VPVTERVAPAGAGQGDGTRPRPEGLLVGALLLAAALRVYPWVRPGGLTGLREYDDGVYYGAARLLLSGVAPYRDATLVHPPGITLLLVPFAALGRLLGDPTGMAAARVAILAVALVNVVLVFRLARQLLGVDGRVAAAAAVVYAVSPNALAAEHTVLLEPVTTLLCLLAVRRLAVSRAWHDRGAGVLLAAAVSVKLFAAAYVIAAVVWLVLRREGRRVLDVLLGLGVGLVAVVGPFFALAPRAAWRDVVLTQLWRPVASTANGLDRVQSMTGLASVPTALAPVLLVALLVAALWGRRDAVRGPLGLWLLLMVVVAGAFLEAATYFPHYGAFLAPAVGILAAASLTPGRARLGACVVTALVVSMAVGAWKWESGLPPQAHLAAVHDAASNARCVWYESASLAIAVDAFAVPTDSCPGWVDQRGQLYATIGSGWAHRDDFYYRGFTTSTRWQTQLVDQMEHADVLLLSRDARDVKEWAPATRDYVLEHFHPEVVADAQDGRPVQLWRRNAA